MPWPVVSFSIGIVGLWATRWPAFLVPVLVAGVLVYSGRRMVDGHVKVENGIFTRLSGGRVDEEFDLRTLEEWSVKIHKDNDGDFSGATLHCKCLASNRVLQVGYSENKVLFKDLLVYLHREQRNLTPKNPAPLEPEFPKSAAEIRSLLKSW